MITSIWHISQSDFKEINKSHEPGPLRSFISIIGNEPDDEFPKINERLWVSGIRLQFDDVEENIPKFGWSMITEEHCKRIIEFIQKIHLDDRQITLIIHCYAGISRSAGVAKWVNDILKLDLPNIRSRNLFNQKVYASLHRTFYNLEVDRDEFFGLK